MPAREARELTIGALSRRTGVHIETIRYYERIGLLPAPMRSPAGHRRYDEAALRRLAFIARCRALGFSLAEVRNLLRLVDDRSVTCAEVRQMTLAHASEVRRKIADLEALERVLSEMAARCHGNAVPDCPIIDALYEREGGGR